MLIIIEGPDKSGKTTLAKEIASYFKYDYAHFGPPGKDPSREYAEFLINLKRPTVCDRFYYGELVYGPLLRGKSVITPLEKATIERLARLRGAILIKATTDLSVIEKRYDAMGDDMITRDQNSAAYYAFKHVLADAKLPTITYAGTPVSLERVLFSMIGMFDMHKYSATIAKSVCSGVGTILGPKIVLVGESLNKNKTWVGVPFDGGSSAEMLNECIKESTIMEKHVYMVNANTLTLDEAEFLNSTGCTKFVALGKVAANVLRNFGIRHAEMPHPQYFKRFKIGSKSDYVQYLSNYSNPCDYCK